MILFSEQQHHKFKDTLQLYFVFIVGLWFVQRLHEYLVPDTLLTDNWACSVSSIFYLLLNTNMKLLSNMISILTIDKFCFRGNFKTNKMRLQDKLDVVMSIMICYWSVKMKICLQGTSVQGISDRFICIMNIFPFSN